MSEVEAKLIEAERLYLDDYSLKAVRLYNECVQLSEEYVSEQRQIRETLQMIHNVGSEVDTLMRPMEDSTQWMIAHEHNGVKVWYVHV